MNENVFAVGPTPRTIRDASGKVQSVPAGWELLAPGDAALTRRVKAAGQHWIVQEKKGNKFFSRGLWAPSETIERIRIDLESERAHPSFAKRKVASAVRRDKVQAAYVEDFQGAVVTFLNFHSVHAELGLRLAEKVTRHATPVGSGTVARTQRIPIERRAESAVIAWLRHQTTAYDSMAIRRVKGERREVRRQLAAHSRQLLASYRRGESPSPNCSLLKSLQSESASEPESE